MCPFCLCFLLVQGTQESAGNVCMDSLLLECLYKDIEPVLTV